MAGIQWSVTKSQSRPFLCPSSNSVWQRIKMSSQVELEEKNHLWNTLLASTGLTSNVVISYNDLEITHSKDPYVPVLPDKIFHISHDAIHSTTKSIQWYCKSQIWRITMTSLRHIHFFQYNSDLQPSTQHLCNSIDGMTTQGLCHQDHIQSWDKKN